jgi:hypothetical protein
VKIEDNSGNVLEYYTTYNTNIIAGGSSQGGDTFYVNGVPSGVTETIEEGNYSCVVNVTQPSGSFDFIRGNLNVDGNNMTLNVYDQNAFNTGQTYTINAHNVIRNGSGGGYHDVHFGNIGAVNLYGAYYGNGSTSNYSIVDTPGWGATTSITTGPGHDTVWVNGTTGQLTVHGMGQISATVGFWGSVQAINGTVIFDNPPSYTSINVDDHGDPTGRTFDMYGFAGWGYLSLPSNAFIEYKYADTSSVTLRTGTGGNTVNVWGTGVTTNVIGNGFQYLDHINVGFNGSVQNIMGTLNISNPSGWWVINVDDSKDAGTRHASLGQSSFSSSWGTLSGLAPASINYDYFDTYGLFIETNNSSSVWVYTDGGVDTWLNGIYV